MSRACPPRPHHLTLRSLTLTALLCPATSAHTQSRLAHQHPRTRPTPALPAPAPVPAPEPAYIPDPVLILSGFTLVIAGGTLGWLLHDRLRRRPLLAANQILQSDRNRLSRDLEQAQRDTTNAIDRYLALKAQTSPPKFTGRAAPQQSSAQRQASEAEQQRLAAEQEERQAEADRRRAHQDLSNPDNQLRFVRAARIFRRKLLNREEDVVFSAALNVIRSANKAFPSPSLAIGVQVSMGEFLGTPKHGTEADKLGFRSINSKRSDFLIYNRSTFRPVLVIEYHGPGHFQGNAAARDAVKRAALERAKVSLLETKSQDPRTLERQIKDKLIACLSTTSMAQSHRRNT